MVRCRSYTLRPAHDDDAGQELNLDGELAGTAPFKAECMPGALEVFASRLRDEPRDTSMELEPRLVMALVDIVGGGV